MNTHNKKKIRKTKIKTYFLSLGTLLAIYNINDKLEVHYGTRK